MPRIDTEQDHTEHSAADTTSYAPADETHWDTVPFTVQRALDLLAENRRGEWHVTLIADGDEQDI